MAAAVSSTAVLKSRSVSAVRSTSRYRRAFSIAIAARAASSLANARSCSP